MKVRPAAVAGMFYPRDPIHLRSVISGLLSEARLAAKETGQQQPHPPRALIAPHAGYFYSGPIAARAYGHWTEQLQPGDSVLIIGPSHRFYFAGLAISEAAAWETPLGSVTVDEKARRELLQLPLVKAWEPPHASEHSIEVHIPFLQYLQREIQILPVVTGAGVQAEQVSQMLAAYVQQPRRWIVVSTDLSHYHPADVCEKLDRETAAHIVAGDAAWLTAERACGVTGLQGLLLLARMHGWKMHQVDLRHSGHTSGKNDAVVGYGAWLAL
ncbi:MAG: MEMO1 family protein [Planctomycetaceae bacterium]|nr:MAG: MEMO1 family protein [Planctomycetaceae bacterium]